MFVFVDDIKLPAKTEIHILINVLHRDPKYFPDPDRFDPNRFLENDIKHPFCYVPFSAGQRNCIGIEIHFGYNDPFHLVRSSSFMFNVFQVKNSR